MMGMGQQMPMRRPPTGPSQMTAGRPNPMATLPQRPGGGPQGPGFPGGPPRTPPWFGGAGPQGPGFPGGAPPTPPWFGNPGGGGGMMPDPYEQNTPGAMWGGQFVPAGQVPPGGAGAYDRDGNLLGGGAQGMSDAMMHPFAPRNRPQFPGAMQGGIMGGMGGGPQQWGGSMGTGQLAPPSQQQVPPWMQRRIQNAIPL